MLITVKTIFNFKKNYTLKLINTIKEENNNEMWILWDTTGNPVNISTFNFCLYRLEVYWSTSCSGREGCWNSRNQWALWLLDWTWRLEMNPNPTGVTGSAPPLWPEYQTCHFFHFWTSYVVKLECPVNRNIQKTPKLDFSPLLVFAQL